jgi:adenylate cyclase
MTASVILREASLPAPRRRTRRGWQWRFVGRMALLSSAAGIAWGFSAEQPLSAAVGALDGCLIGGTLTAFGTFVLDAPAGAAIRRWPLALWLLVRAALYAIVILGVLALGAWIGVLLGLPPAASLLDRNLAFALAISLAISIATTVRRVIGPRLGRLLLGHYRRAREEQLVVLFMDLRGSTGLAERLGNERFVRLLDDIIFAASGPITENGGQIYQYVGDEIILTWPIGSSAIDPGCLACPFAILTAIAARAAEFERRYGAVPSFRIALHAGTLLVSELGDIKREIVLIGDVMNAASRILDICRETGQECLASAAVVTRLARPPAGLALASIGSVTLRGKSAPLELYAVTAE